MGDSDCYVVREQQLCYPFRIRAQEETMECKLQLLQWQQHWCCSFPLISASQSKKLLTPKQRYLSFFTKSAKIGGGGLRLRPRPVTALPKKTEQRQQPIIDIDGFGLGNSGIIISSCLVGLFTGIVVVIFNNSVHEIRDIFWDGIPHRGASWLREEPIESIWSRVVLVPAGGGLFVSLIKALQATLEEENISNMNFYDYLKAALQPLLKATAACFTLGTGNSLGPEGPSVEIGKSIAKGIGNLFYLSPQKSLPLVAAGAAAGISSGWYTGLSFRLNTIIPFPFSCIMFFFLMIIMN